MHDNHIYNLLNQIVQEQKSLWRIKNDYCEDAAKCDKCVEMWQEVEKMKEDQVEKMTKLLKSHLG
jgi:hypothetical protein